MLHYMGKACVQLALVQVTYKLMHSWLLFIAQISYKCIMLLIEGGNGNVDESVKTPLLSYQALCQQNTIFTNKDCDFVIR